MHYHLALPVLVAPRQRAAVRLLRAEPRLGAVRTRTHGEIRNLLPAENSLLPREMPCGSDHTRSRRRADILRLHRAHFIRHALTHVQHAQIAVRFIEDRLALRLTRNVRFAPVHFDFLPRVAMDLRHPHPDARRPRSRIPLLDLISQRFPVGGKAHVISVRFRRREVEEILVQPHEQGEALHARIRRKIRAIGRGVQEKRAGVFPIGILRESAPGTKCERGKAVEQVFDVHIELFRSVFLIILFSRLVAIV